MNRHTVRDRASFFQHLAVHCSSVPKCKLVEDEKWEEPTTMFHHNSFLCSLMVPCWTGTGTLQILWKRILPKSSKISLDHVLSGGCQYIIFKKKPIGFSNTPAKSLWKIIHLKIVDNGFMLTQDHVLHWNWTFSQTPTKSYLKTMELDKNWSVRQRKS